jgi:hypothetical protein
MSSRPKVRPEEALAAHCTRWRPRPNCASQPTNVSRLFQNSVLDFPRPILPNSSFTQITLSPGWQCVIFSSQEVINWTKSQMNSIASCFVWLCNSVFYKSLKVKVMRKPRSGWKDNIKTDRALYNEGRTAQDRSHGSALNNCRTINMAWRFADDLSSIYDVRSWSRVVK